MQGCSTTGYCKCVLNLVPFGKIGFEVNSASTAAVLSGNAPSIIQLNENFDAGIPSDWPIKNNSDVIGSNLNWSQGNPIVFATDIVLPHVVIDVSCSSDE